VKDRKRHIVTDTTGLMVGATVHPADVQDRDGAPLVVEAIHERESWTTVQVRLNPAHDASGRVGSPRASHDKSRSAAARTFGSTARSAVLIPGEVARESGMMSPANPI
jgi:hypothetical protein